MKRAEKYHIIKKLKNSDSLCFQWVSEFLFSPTVKDGIISQLFFLYNPGMKKSVRNIIVFSQESVILEVDFTSKTDDTYKGDIRF